MALGGGIGQGVGGYLLDAGAQVGVPSLIWWVASLVGVLSMHYDVNIFVQIGLVVLVGLALADKRLDRREAPS